MFGQNQQNLHLGNKVEKPSDLSEILSQGRPGRTPRIPIRLPGAGCPFPRDPVIALPYQPEIDGVRASAVLPVMLLPLPHPHRACTMYSVASKPAGGANLCRGVSGGRPWAWPALLRLQWQPWPTSSIVQQFRLAHVINRKFALGRKLNWSVLAGQFSAEGNVHNILAFRSFRVYAAGKPSSECLTCQSG